VSINLASLATWSYDTGTLTHIASQQSVVIDIAGNVALHNILSAQHWKNLGSKEVYSSNPADWLERKIKWTRASEDPPVLQIEQTIGGADFVDYTVYLLEDSSGYSEIFDNMADILNDGVLNGFTRVHVKSLMKDMVQAMQKAGLIGGSDVA